MATNAQSGDDQWFGNEGQMNNLTFYIADADIGPVVQKP